MEDEIRRLPPEVLAPLAIALYKLLEVLLKSIFSHAKKDREAITARVGVLEGKVQALEMGKVTADGMLAGLNNLSGQINSKLDLVLKRQRTQELAVRTLQVKAGIPPEPEERE